jgi:prevent-host-death family protein
MAILAKLEDLTMRTMTSAEAQNHFGELLDAAQREPVTITRRGRPVALVISQQEYEALLQGREITNSQSSKTAAIAAFRGKGKGGAVERLLMDRRADRDREA